MWPRTSGNGTPLMLTTRESLEMGLTQFTVQRLTMRVSVVTVCFNASETIENTLASVAAQSHPDVEHIIVDGGSTDDTLAIVARFPHVSRVVSEQDDGLYDAMNKGWQLASGEFVGWLNADDMLAAPDSLARIVEAARPDAVRPGRRSPW